MIQFLEKIEKHFEDCYPREGCGVLVIIRGELQWYPCTNVAQDKDDFIFDSEEYLKISQKGDIVGIVHSHPDGEAYPSPADIKYCNTVGLTYYIFNYPQMDMYVLEPEKSCVPLLGREYEFGVQDCFEAARDYYISEGLTEIPCRSMFEDNWWKKGLDYFTENVIKHWDFKKVEGNLQKNDFLVFSVQSDIGNHCGVYLGDDIFFHHAEHRLSCRENLYPFWKKYLLGVYRYAP